MKRIWESTKPVTGARRECSLLSWSLKLELRRVREGKASLAVPLNEYKERIINLEKNVV